MLVARSIVAARDAMHRRSADRAPRRDRARGCRRRDRVRCRSAGAPCGCARGPPARQPRAAASSRVTRCARHSSASARMRALTGTSCRKRWRQAGSSMRAARASRRSCATASAAARLVARAGLRQRLGVRQPDHRLALLDLAQPRQRVVRLARRGQRRRPRRRAPAGRARRDAQRRHLQRRRAPSASRSRAAASRSAAA